MALDDGASGDHTIPQLNYQTWNDFHSRHDGTPLFSIDILRTSQPEFGIPTEHQPTELPERIRINSPSVVQILNKLRLSKHPKDGPVILFGPYKTLFFFDQEIRQMVAELDRNKCSTPANISVGPDASGSGGENQLAHLRCLIQFMDTHLCARLDFLQGPDCNTILFSDLWLLYKPGDFVVTHDLRQAYQVLRVETKRRIVERNGKIVIEDESAVIHCVYIDFDGQWLGPVHHKVVVEGWALSKLVESLELLPLNRVTLKEKALKQELIRRGQLFVQAAGISAIHYDGRAVDSETQVNGTIIIDFEEALRSEADFKAWRTTIDHSLAGARKPASGFEGDQNEPQPCAAEQGMLYEDSYVDELRYQTYLQSQHTMDKSGYQVPNSAICPRPLHRAEVLTEDELLITNYRAFGYILDNGTLQSNAWGVFDLSLASPISEKASLEFDDFVIPNHVKEMVRNLTTHHLKQMPPSSIISDRCTINKHEGQGLVLLLHGLPGLGKKSTVASIAKMAGVPLLHISTELLWKEIRNGSTENLESSFTFAKRWGCIVMLTQADTILQEDLDYSQAPSISQVDIWNHAPQSVLRRAVVRMMDSFTGITFLIADHGPPLRPVMGSSTKEITSRINANFHYPPLDKAQTTKMFEINMRWINDVFSKQYRDSPRPATLVVDEDILGFATAFYKQRSSFDRWNCTQIRKAFTTALALAQTDAGLSPEGQTGDGPREAWKVTLKAAHFEVVARSLYRSLGGEPPPPPPGGKKKYNDPTYMGHPPPPQQGAPNPYQYQRPRQQLPQQPPPPPPPPPQVSPPIFLPNSRLLPPVEYRAQLPPPPLGQTIGGHPPPPPGLPTVMPGKEFFLASPLSMDARPVLDLLDWEKFKDARSGKGDACAAIEMLKGNPVVSFDMQAQGSVWWSRWGERNREDIPRDKSEAGATAFHKGTDPDGSQSTPLPERIRIHSKYITKILEDIHGSRISKTSFVMFRPFRALTYYEQRIRAKYNELATMQGDATSGSDSGAGVRDPGDNTSEMQPDHPRIYEEDGLTWKEEAKPPTDDTSSSYISERSISDVGEVIDTACNAALQHLACLVEFVDMIRARRQYLLSGNCSKVTFADVWHLFKPGDVVLDQEQRQAYRILSFNSSGHRTLPPWKDFDSEQRPIIVLRAVHITFDGEMLGSLRTNFEIVSFEGEVDISSLPVLPLRLARDPDINARKDSSAFRRNLVERGRMFVKMAQSMPMHYNGPLLHPKEEVDSQVVVDFEQAFAFWARAPGFVRPVVEKLIGKTIGYPLVDIPCYASCCAGETVYHDAYAEQKWNEAYIGTLIPDPQDRTQKPSLAIFPRAIRDKNFEEATVSDEDLVIMSYKVCGFVLRNRRWAQMDLKYLSPLNPGARHRHVATTASSGGDMATNPSATEATTLEQLVLPLGHKNIVKSLISQHFQDKATGRYEAEEKDVVRGKGKGLIILLHGAPGVGKTSTAEGVAEAFNKPLFQITSGDLGTNARELEEALEWHFYLANKWDCVLLLDEADVFLSVRSPEDFQRNSLVAVFLRVLEYYAGVLFLTTNRIGDFDEAFSSRIHISLYYPPLNRSSTKKIFDLNLRNIQQRIKERGVDIEVEHDHILSWAVDYWRRNKKMRWNGRQIRNACQTALALAEYDSQHPAGSTPRESADQEEIAPEKNATIKLTIGHLETVAKAYLEFMRYLHEIYGKDAERRAKALGIRAREFSMKNWAAAQGALPQEEEDDNESDEEEATGAEAAQSNKRGLQQEPMDKGKAAPETLIPGLAQQQTTSFAGSPYPYAPFAMPNLPNPYAVPPQFGQTQQPQAAPYQNAADQQRQYFANVAAWNNMLAVGQQVPFPGMAGMPTQAQGGPQGDASFPPRTGV